MAEQTKFIGNLWCLTVLCLLREHSLHPYEMQSLIRQRKKDQFLDLKRGSLYHAVERLQTHSLIEAIASERQGRRPERTTYRITEKGEQELLSWLRALLRDVSSDQNAIFAALSFLGHLPPLEVCELLEERANSLTTTLTQIKSERKAVPAELGRIVLIETEYFWPCVELN